MPTDTVIAVKTCSMCQQVKAVVEFSKDCTAKDGLQSRCKPCGQAASRAWKAANFEKDVVNKKVWYQENREQILAHYAEPTRKAKRYASSTAWAKENPEACREASKRSKQRNPDRVEEDTFISRFRKHGLTLDQYHAMAERQDFCCAICREIPVPKHCKSSPDGFVIDHSHVSGKVRGLLCPSCNVALGQLRDNPHTARKAATYLETTV